MSDIQITVENPVDFLRDSLVVKIEIPTDVILREAQEKALTVALETLQRERLTARLMHR